MLSNKQLTSVCKIGCGADCCRYIIGTPNGFQCGKLNNDIKKAIDAQVNIMIAKSDNCEGQ